MVLLGSLRLTNVMIIRELTESFDDSAFRTAAFLALSVLMKIFRGIVHISKS